MVCWDGESGSRRKWEEPRVRELHFRSCACEVPTGHLSILQKASCQIRAQEAGPANLVLHFMVAGVCLFIPLSISVQVPFLSLSWLLFAFTAHESCEVPGEYHDQVNSAA